LNHSFLCGFCSWKFYQKYFQPFFLFLLEGISLPVSCDEFFLIKCQNVQRGFWRKKQKYFSFCAVILELSSGWHWITCLESGPKKSNEFIPCSASFYSILQFHTLYNKNVSTYCSEFLVFNSFSPLFSSFVPPSILHDLKNQTIKHLFFGFKNQF